MLSLDTEVSDTNINGFFVSYNCLYLHYSINNKNFYLFLDMNIGNIISQSRDKNAYFQSDLAEKSNVSTEMIGKYHQNEKNPNLRSGIFYAGAIYKGQATFFGDNRESRLHSIQNYIHKNMVHYTPYFADLGLKSKPYFYSGSFHSSYLFY